MSDGHDEAPVQLPLGPPDPEAPPWLPGIRRGRAARKFWTQLAHGVEALAERYPRHLRELPEDWWRWPALSEQLGALCVWRLTLDTGAAPALPQTELEFHEALDRLQALLDERARAVLTARDDHPRHPGEPAEQRRRRLRRALGLTSALAALDGHEVTSRDPASAFWEPLAGRPGAVAAPEHDDGDGVHAAADRAEAETGATPPTDPPAYDDGAGTGG